MRAFANSLSAEDYEVRVEESLAPHTTFRIGGRAALFVAPRNVAALVRLAAKLHRAGMYYRVFGAFSNILVSDVGMRGVAVVTKHLTDCKQEGNVLIASCGLPLAVLARRALAAGLSGVEGLAGIPGTVGGALVMNAGAFGYEVSDVVTDVLCYLPQTDTLQMLSQSDLAFSYRTSALPAGAVVLSVRFRLTADAPDCIAARMTEFAARRRVSQPHLPSAGSIFRRPAPGLSAGKLIADCGMAGMQRGRAQISPIHAGFICNLGGASAADVLHLMREARTRVLAKTGYLLEPEVEYLRAQAERK